jgi:hypothetical protein
MFRAGGPGSRVVPVVITVGMRSDEVPYRHLNNGKVAAPCCSNYGASMIGRYSRQGPTASRYCLAIVLTV